MSAAAVRELWSTDRTVFVRVGASACLHAELRSIVHDDGAGAIVTFEGVTRNVAALEYEAYVEMAAEQLQDIAQRALRETGALRAAIEHVVGTVPLGAPSVMILVSAAHRGPAFTAARRILDELKERAPIWKVEIDGATRTRVAGVVPEVDSA